MSWLFSQALVEEYLGDTSLDGEQSAQSNGNLTPQAYLSHGKTTGFSRLSRYGMTVKPLTDTRGEELCKLYREAFLARTFQLQEKVQESQAADPQCGSTWLASLAKYDPNTHLWRTVQCSLLEDLNESLQTLPAWGMTVGGELYLRQTLVQTIKEKESGLWPTPNTLEGLAPKKLDRIMEYNNKSRPGRSYASMNLREQVVYGKIPIWPTPTAHMAKETNAPSEALRNEPSLSSRVGGTLNPTWVEWLMGWPLGWTDLKPLEMGKFQQWQQEHGVCLNKNL